MSTHKWDCEYCRLQFDPFQLAEHHFNKHPEESWSRAHGLFHYSPDGGASLEVNPDPPTEAEARPFHVVWNSPSYIPISVLVFAHDVEHAMRRVVLAVQECNKKHYKPRPDKYGQMTEGRGKRLLEELASGKLQAHAEPYDIARLCATVNWASNGGPL